MIVSRRDLEDSLARVRAEVRDPRGGIHGPGSAAWELQREALSFLGGGRAALLQLAHPFVAYAIEQHSKTREDALGRFQRTFKNVFAMSFGDLDAAFVAARRVHNVHTHIHGLIPSTVGPYPAGTRYDANDADSLKWVWATLVHTVVHVRELVIGRIARRLKDDYVDDTWQFARLFGIPEALRVGGWSALDRYVAEMAASDVLTVAPPAREMARFLFGERKTRTGRWLELMTTGLLPSRLRKEFGLPWGMRERAVFSASVAGIGVGWRGVPARFRWLPAYVDATRRLEGKAPSKVARWMDQRMEGLAGMVAGK